MTKKRIGWNYLYNNKLADIEYADDIFLITNSISDAKNMMEKLVEKSATIGLRINVNKMKEMRMGIDVQEKTLINQQEMQVEELYYLRSILNKKGGTEADIQ